MITTEEKMTGRQRTVYEIYEEMTKDHRRNEMTICDMNSMFLFSMGTLFLA